VEKLEREKIIKRCHLFLKNIPIFCSSWQYASNVLYR